MPSDDRSAIQTEYDDLMARLADVIVRAHALGLRPWETRRPALLPPDPPADVPGPVVPPPLPVPLPEPAPEPEPVRPSARMSVVPNWRNVLREYLRTLRDRGTVDREMTLLNDLARDQSRLGRFPPEIQVALLAYAVARLRTLQERNLVSDARVFTVISVVAAYAQKSRVGFVYGPKRTDRPQTGSWEQDAEEQTRALQRRTEETVDGQPNVQRLIDGIRDLVSDAAPYEEIQPLFLEALTAGVPSKHPQLVKLAAPFLPQMEANRAFKSLRAGIRAAHIDATKDVPPAMLLPEDWPWFPFVRGKRAVMVGGEPREPNRLRILSAFGFGSFDWEGTEFRRNQLQMVRERIQTGGTDFVILLRRFVGHDADEILLPACRDRGVPWISVVAGYGIQRIRSEIERMIPLPPPPF